MKRIKVRLPSGKTSVRSKRRRVSSSKCASCRKTLHGIQRLHPIDVKNLSKTEKRPSRLYGGYFCGGCTKELLRERARLI